MAKTAITGIAAGPNDSVARAMQFLSNKPDVTIKPLSSSKRSNAPIRREPKQRAAE